MSKAREDESPEEVDRQQTGVPGKIAAAHSAGTEDSDDDDFEFAFVVRDCDADSLITADEIFSNGQIRSVYPVFNRGLALAAVGEGDKFLARAMSRLVIEERELVSSPPSCSGDHLEGLRPETYCLWTPGSSGKCRKSGSTGSFFRWRIRDLLVRRSRSDGKEKFVFVASKEKPVAAMVEGEEQKGKGCQLTEVDIIAAHKRYFHQGQGGTAKGAGGGGKSFLPYKPDILGFFAGVKGSSRLHRPF